jgi:glycosyltransferase involved in cell wall biosynthesis
MLTDALSIGDRVHFLGKRNPVQLAELYHLSDLLLLPSAWEALPSVISEAMLCGLPFVASATGGIPEQANGFGVVLSPELPALMRKELRPALDVFLKRNGLELESFAGFLLHPGGRKILETAKSTFEQLAAASDDARRATGPRVAPEEFAGPGAPGFETGAHQRPAGIRRRHQQFRQAAGRFPRFGSRR